MHPSKKPRIKICCIQDANEAWTAIRYGAAALGLVSHMPSGPGPIPEDDIREIAHTIPPGISRFLLTSLSDPAAIISQQKRLGLETIQLCDRIAPGGYRKLRESMPGTRLVQVIHVTGPESIEAAIEVCEQVDAILLDSGRPDAAVPELGGTGRLHDWLISRKIREAVTVPVFLAGGLNPTNVAEAMNRVAPYGLDVCSGVRQGSRLDERKLAAFFEAVADR